MMSFSEPFNVGPRFTVLIAALCLLLRRQARALDAGRGLAAGRDRGGLPWPGEHDADQGELASGHDQALACLQTLTSYPKLGKRRETGFQRASLCRESYCWFHVKEGKALKHVVCEAP